MKHFKDEWSYDAMPASSNIDLKTRFNRMYYGDGIYGRGVKQRISYMDDEDRRDIQQHLEIWTDDR